MTLPPLAQSPRYRFRSARAARAVQIARRATPAVSVNRRHPPVRRRVGDVMRGKYEFPGIKTIHGIEIERPVIPLRATPSIESRSGAQSIQCVVVLASISRPNLS
jgi:DNA-directed RNA polymerase subunit K/omega